MGSTAYKNYATLKSPRVFAGCDAVARSWSVQRGGSIGNGRVRFRVSRTEQESEP
jgi:hypothetical protein